MEQVSTGTKAVFLSPTDALHGDIGIVGEADLLVAFSKSGGSEELLKLLPFAKVRAIETVAMEAAPWRCMPAAEEVAMETAPWSIASASA